MKRRSFFNMALLGVYTGIYSFPKYSHAQELLNDTARIEAGLTGIIADAEALGLLDASTEESALPSSNDYDEALIRTLHTIDRLESSTGVDSRRLLILDQLYAVLARLNAAVRTSSVDQKEEEAAPSFDSLRLEYERLFVSCTPRVDRKDTIRWYVSRIAQSNGQQHYRAVERKTGVPWYFIGVVHALEASFNFRGHLHNGDPLTRRTQQIPRGRPPVWNPPSDWESSATDAVAEFTEDDDWSIPQMLYRFEKYNGFGNRRKGINSPYLWSFSNHYSKGKYVRDGVFDPQAVSKQCGAAVLLKALVEAGHVKGLVSIQ
ncbi:hypothetical protein [Sinorhizobium medicae]|uniref:hypothetical protein n=1 Tax=Sinorhizobium medicae TaxID=110321 RepID=UPI000FDCB32B|nr:hypothetical protein [Sinorhizobium medicae]RVO72913.1 hypothetical protein CN084_26460 [Sinorhizobium medicae]